VLNPKNSLWHICTLIFSFYVKTFNLILKKKLGSLGIKQNRRFWERERERERNLSLLENEKWRVLITPLLKIYIDDLKFEFQLQKLSLFSYFIFYHGKNKTTYDIFKVLNKYCLCMIFGGQKVIWVFKQLV
jgi:hypothetical protein